MLKCHYTYHQEFGKILIPGCWPVVHYHDMSQCTCRDFHETLAQYERKDYNDKIREKNHYIKELESEISRLHRILKRVNGFR